MEFGIQISNTYLKFVILIIIAWIFVFILMRSGLTQVNKLQKEYIERKGN